MKHLFFRLTGGCLLLTGALALVAPVLAAPAAPAPAAAPVPAAAPAAVPAAAPAADPAAPVAAVAAVAPAAPAAPAAVPAPAPVPPPVEQFKTAKFWPGGITMGMFFTKEIAMRDLEASLLEAQYEPKKVEETLPLQKAPEPGKQWVFISVKVFPNRSIGKYDYVLMVGENPFPCLGMGQGDDPRKATYDARVWEIKGAAEGVHLLYALPIDVRDVTLRSALSTTMPQKEVLLRLVAEPAEDGAVAAPAAAAAPAAGAEAVAPVAAPAAAPATAPAAAPAVTP